MNDKKKACIAAIVGNLMFIPCVIALLVAFHFNSPALIITCFILLFALPQIAIRILSRRLFRSEAPLESTRQREYIPIIERLFSKKKLWIFGSVGFIFSAITGMAYSSTLAQKSPYSIPLMVGVILILSLGNAVVVIGAAWLVKNISIKFYKRYEQRTDRFSSFK
jgi:MFS family permease